LPGRKVSRCFAAVSLFLLAPFFIMSIVSDVFRDGIGLFLGGVRRVRNLGPAGLVFIIRLGPGLLRFG
jgi:hypothetical protein